MPWYLSILCTYCVCKLKSLSVQTKVIGTVLFTPRQENELYAAPNVLVNCPEAVRQRRKRAAQ